MLRFQPIVVVSLGLFAAVPLGAQGTTLFQQLQDELQRTEAALSDLQRVEELSRLGVPYDLEDLRTRSEQPTAPPDFAQVRLEALQLEVRELGVQLDTLRTRRGAAEPGSPSALEVLDGLEHPVEWSTGLAPERRQKLDIQRGLEMPPGARSELGDPIPAMPNGALDAAEQLAANTESTVGVFLEEWRAKHQPKPMAPAPTSLGHARSLYRGGRIQAALERFDSLAPLPEAVFYAGRCLERLDRAQEAVDRYATLDADGVDSTWRERATEAIDFLVWREGLEGRQLVIPAPESEGEGSEPTEDEQPEEQS